ncbi:endonuclease-8 [Leifsonia sp. AK011]|uniref:Fpg/Nei family DNA glycosylase n=1 Tax=Leifsonia sp. AK011 TaxID=2723075 RepID=UPI0015C99D56|nr:Fpg/Nei family DNA glycosylase [Leifsonia sp. AK011]NYF10735.1 endonuclease-8 [Leifsonia sp. AK011]
MPEGDTVYRSAVNLNAVLAGETLTRCDIRVPAFATVDLTGQTVEEVVPRGKHILMRVGDHTLHSHLKMEGSWHIYGPKSRWQRPAWQARAVLATERTVAVGFELGLFEVVRRSDEESIVGYLGPDLLGPDWDPAVALENLSRQPDRAIGVALLDQRVLAGLGNVYRSEICFLSGVLPTRPVGEVGSLPQLVDLAHRLITANRDRPERTTTGNLWRDRTWVYGRTGAPCRRCGTRLLHGEIGDNELQLRQVWWCPHCQT